MTASVPTILAGQSNMQGQGSLRNVDYLIYNESRGYHCLGSGKMMYQMGTAFAQGMIKLLGE